MRAQLPQPLLWFSQCGRRLSALCADADETSSLVQFRLWGLRENVSWSCRTQQRRRRRPRRLIPSCPLAARSARPVRRRFAAAEKLGLLKEADRRPAPA